MNEKDVEKYITRNDNDKLVINKRIAGLEEENKKQQKDIEGRDELILSLRKDLTALEKKVEELKKHLDSPRKISRHWKDRIIALENRKLSIFDLFKK